jgi:hypothetical protein
LWCSPGWPQTHHLPASLQWGDCRCAPPCMASHLNLMPIISLKVISRYIKVIFKSFDRLQIVTSMYLPWNFLSQVNNNCLPF